MRRAIVVSTLLTSLTILSHLTHAQAPPDVPPQYKKLFYYNNDQRSLYQKILNNLGIPTNQVGRSFALIAGVTQYPNFPEMDRELKPAQVDIEKLKSYLKTQEYFDQIVVLKDGDMNLDTLNYFLENYFPEQLRKSPHSRFLFAYSGHGYADGTDATARGYLLTSSAVSKTDVNNRIDLNTIRSFLSPDVDAAEKVLVLVNACQSGAFLGRKAFGANPLGPGDRGAHAIMASRTSEQSLSLSSVGPGSVFFEKIFAGLNGIADKSPPDGVVTYHELDTYLRSEIPYATNGSQIPMEGDISPNGSVGEFFFLNRNRQVQLGNNKPWNPGTLVTFGTQAEDSIEKGRAAFDDRHYDNAAQSFEVAAAQGNPDAMTQLGYLYASGEGVAQDYKAARMWDEKAAAAGVATAMYNLGLLNEQGQGGPKDQNAAMQWFEKAADKGNSDAMVRLGTMYQWGLGAHEGRASLYPAYKGVTRDYAQAKAWYEKAAAAGNSQAMNSLGYLYAAGDGVPQDYEKAFQWYEKASNAGNASATASLGASYEKGLGVDIDYRKARILYEKAAEAGDGSGMAGLGSLYQHGFGVTKDLVKAREWYEKAKAAGDYFGAAAGLMELNKR